MLAHTFAKPVKIHWQSVKRHCLNFRENIMKFLSLLKFVNTKNMKVFNFYWKIPYLVLGRSNLFIVFPHLLKIFSKYMTYLQMQHNAFFNPNFSFILRFAALLQNVEIDTWIWGRKLKQGFIDLVSTNNLPCNISYVVDSTRCVMRHNNGIFSKTVQCKTVCKSRIWCLKFFSRASNKYRMKY